MLAGRNDITSVAYYSSNYAKQVQDGDSPYANGAYGYRWRHAYAGGRTGSLMPHREDQLKLLISHLKAKPESRRAVLAMWNVEDDLLKIDSSRDVCCNLSVHFMVETGLCRTCDGQAAKKGWPEPCETCGGQPHERPRYLNMTVFNRSNDMIWGSLGANYVHFTMLQEYMAAHLGLECGKYHQISSNAHVYTERFEAEKWLEEYKTHRCDYSCVEGETWKLIPLVKDPAVFDHELPEFVSRHGKDAVAGVYREPFLVNVAQPMCIAFHHYKRKEYREALQVAGNIAADDWRIVSEGWIRRRMEKREAKA